MERGSSALPGATVREGPAAYASLAAQGREAGQGKSLDPGLWPGEGASLPSCEPGAPRESASRDGTVPVPPQDDTGICWHFLLRILWFHVLSLSHLV